MADTQPTTRVHTDANWSPFPTSSAGLAYRDLCMKSWDAMRVEEQVAERHGYGSSEWREAHATARDACLARSREATRLAREDRRGDWPTLSDRELMLKGYL